MALWVCGCCSGSAGSLEFAAVSPLRAARVYHCRVVPPSSSVLLCRRFDLTVALSVLMRSDCCAAVSVAMDVPWLGFSICRRCGDAAEVVYCGISWGLRASRWCGGRRAI